MILFCCASDLGPPEDLSAIEVILLLLLPPEAKCQKTAPPIEEVEQPPPPLDDEQDPELHGVIRENRASIRTHKSHGPVQSRYNFRLTTSDTRILELGQIFSDQTSAIKLNLS